MQKDKKVIKSTGEAGSASQTNGNTTQNPSILGLCHMPQDETVQGLCSSASCLQISDFSHPASWECLRGSQMEPCKSKAGTCRHQVSAAKERIYTQDKYICNISVLSRIYPQV